MLLPNTYEKKKELTSKLSRSEDQRKSAEKATETKVEESTRRLRDLESDKTKLEDRVKSLETQLKNMELELKKAKERTPETAGGSAGGSTQEWEERVKAAEQKVKMVEIKLKITSHKLAKATGSDSIEEEEEQIKQAREDLKKKDEQIAQLESKIKTLGSSGAGQTLSAPIKSVSHPARQPAATSSSPSLPVGTAGNPKEIGELKEMVTKLEAEVKKAHMQGRIAQKREEKSRIDQVIKAQEENKACYEQFISKLRGELDQEQSTLKLFQDLLDKATSEFQSFEMRYIKAEHCLKEQDKLLKEIFAQLKTSAKGNKAMEAILAKEPPTFETFLPLREMNVKYGVPVKK